MESVRNTMFMASMTTVTCEEESLGDKKNPLLSKKAEDGRNEE